MALWFVVFGLFWQEANSSVTVERLEKLQVKQKKNYKSMTLFFQKKEKRVISESLCPLASVQMWGEIK